MKGLDEKESLLNESSVREGKDTVVTIEIASNDLYWSQYNKMNRSAKELAFKQYPSDHFNYL